MEPCKKLKPKNSQHLNADCRRTFGGAQVLRAWECQLPCARVVLYWKSPRRALLSVASYNYPRERHSLYFIANNVSCVWEKHALLRSGPGTKLRGHAEFSSTPEQLACARVWSRVKAAILVQNRIAWRLEMFTCLLFFFFLPYVLFSIKCIHIQVSTFPWKF